MIKLLVSDLDGTLLPFDKKVTEKDISALERAKKSGIDICFASGRMDIEINEVLKSINEKFHRISQNGAFISTNQDVQLLATTFESELAKQIFNEVRSLEFITLVCSYDTNFTEQKNEHVLNIEKRMFHPITESPFLLDEIPTIKPSKITVLGEEKAIIQFQQRLLSQYPNQIDTYISEKQCLDIMPKNISKGNAVTALINQLGYEPSEVATIGDSYNDIPMFRLTENSFVMSHSHKDVQKEAMHVVNSVSDAIDIILEKNRQLSKK
ncbi:HAD family hydrolase [Cytobacillus sp. S13-E01]|uniref:HAD family hydrolase n=1 Tax=Cytobacillus sp. S13-E01 TaxID=3031326 RepID=UPI0023D802AA|nr:HAD family hydrolase [Cytobacillus sp. S13-E01]MDF0725442.1 HAD family hydrolase [Cytobacillus sp. S13-E01]